MRIAKGPRKYFRPPLRIAHGGAKGSRRRFSIVREGAKVSWRRFVIARGIRAASRGRFCESRGSTLGMGRVMCDARTGQDFLSTGFRVAIGGSEGCRRAIGDAADHREFLERDLPMPPDAERVESGNLSQLVAFSLLKTGDHTYIGRSYPWPRKLKFLNPL